jgi:VWFA-related protein
MTKAQRPDRRLVKLRLVAWGAAAVFISWSGLLLLLPRAAPAFGQAPQQENPGGVIRITVNLVQIDAVVTDSKGRQVTDLKPDDFEILEDRRPQKITNFSYVSMAPLARGVKPAPAVLAVTPGVLPAPLRPQAARRMVLVVDDLGLSFESTYYVRQALKKFVERQMQSGDLAAILRTSRGVGVLQQFTDNKHLLDTAIERVRWDPMGRAGISAFPPMKRDLSSFMNSAPNTSQSAPSSSQGGPNPSQGGATTSQSKSTPTLSNPGAETGFMAPVHFTPPEEFWQANFTVGTLGALIYIINGMRDVPGRKSVILFSDGFNLPLDASSDRRVLDTLGTLVELANRSSVVIYAIDARGLQVLGLGAEDVTTGRRGAQVGAALASRRQRLFNTQAGMAYLAGKTGGFLVHDTNDLNQGVQRVLEDESGYYLIGYKPSAKDFQGGKAGAKIHKLKVRVKVAGLHVRSRSQFYGVEDEAARPVYHTRDEQVAAALASPFDTAGVRVSLASQFLNREPWGPELRVVLHVDARDLSLQNQPDGSKNIVFDAAVMTYGENGAVADAKYFTFTNAPSEANLETVLKSGLDYLIEVPVEKPGAYQLRAAVRDPPTGRVGSVSQFIDVPDLRKGRLTVSGLVLNATGRGEEGPAVRRFQPGERVSYGFEVYNAQLDPTTNQAQLDGLIRIFRDRDQVAVLRAEPSRPEERPDPTIPTMSGRLQLSCTMPPGEYLLQATITDTLAKGKYSAAGQWTDFEVASAPANCATGEHSGP